MALVLNGRKKAVDLCPGDWIEFLVDGTTPAWMEITRLTIDPDLPGPRCSIVVAWAGPHHARFPKDAYVQVAHEEMD